MKTNRGLILIFTSLLLAGCTASGTADTATLAPSATATATKFPTPEPRKTPLPTRKPSATLLSRIDVPSWLGDPNVNVLMISTGIQESNSKFRADILSLYNADTGERFDIPKALDALAYFWMPDGNSVGILTQDMQTIMLIDTSSGEINRYSVDEGMTKFFYFPKNAFGIVLPLSVRGSSPLEENFLLSDKEFIWEYNYDPISPDGRLLIQVEPEEYRYTELVDLMTGEITRITSPDDKYYDVDFRWIPDSNYLSIVQRDAPPVDPYVNEIKPSSHRVILYDVVKGSMVTYFNNVYHIEWSPDYTQILYDSGGRYYFQEEYDFGGTPCILDVFTGETECLRYIRNYHGRQILRDFSWSPDGTQISYTYEGSTPDPYFETGGLCIVVLKTNSISCPTDSILELDVGDSIHLSTFSYSWSPNSKQVALTAAYCIPCDDINPWQRLVILSADGSYYHDLGLTYFNFNRFPGLWRPPITD